MRISRSALAFAGALAVISAAPPTAREVLPWTEDYAKAVADARARNVPIFVEAWAPW